MTMRITALATTLGIGLLAAAGCQADQEAFEQGGTLETPPAVEQAPATPMQIPPQEPALPADSPATQNTLPSGDTEL